MTANDVAYDAALAMLRRRVSELGRTQEIEDQLPRLMRALSKGRRRVPSEQARPDEALFTFEYSTTNRSTGEVRTSTETVALRPAPTDARDIVAKATIDPAWYDATIDIIVSQLLDDKELLPELRKFAAEVLSGERIRPKQPGRKKRFYLNLRLINLVDDACALGLNATRNDATAECSACDAVAQVMREFGLTPSSYKRIKAIWQARGSEIERNLEP